MTGADHTLAGDPAPDAPRRRAASNRRWRFGRSLSAFAGLALLALAGCEREAPPPEKPAAVTLTPIDIAALPGWQSDDLAQALPAWRLSCGKILERSPDAALGPDGIAGTAGAWQPLCREILLLPAEDAAVRRFLVGISPRCASPRTPPTAACSRVITSPNCAVRGFRAIPIRCRSTASRRTT